MIPSVTGFCVPGWLIRHSITTSIITIPAFPDAQRIAMSSIPIEWQECYSNKHKQKYWFNSVTNESRWTDPNESSQTNGVVSDTTTNITTASPGIYEDSPIIANERDRYAEICLDVLTTENSKYGKMQGTTKTARSCNTDGMRIGMYGIYARVIWSQLLNQVVTVGDVGSNIRDSIFPTLIMPDDAVEKEFIDGGRTVAQAKDILHKLGEALVDASRNLVRLQSEKRHLIDTLRVTLTVDSAAVSTSSGSSSSNVGAKRKLDAAISDASSGSTITTIDRNRVYSLSFEGVTHSISGMHFAKILNLYRLHTDPSATVDDPVFVSTIYTFLSDFIILKMRCSLMS